jgi:fatty-acyl-CoA synthase
MGEPKLHGLMMDDYPLSLTAVVERAELLTPARKVVYRRPDGIVHRTTMGDCARRARRLGSALAGLGIGEGDRVGTLMWNQPEHLEAYYAVPVMGAVVHTLNPRLHPDELGFIAGDAEDRAIIVDESLLPVLESCRVAHEFEHVIVVSSGDPARRVPDGAIDYESLVESAEPMAWPAPHERRACAICYTSGTTGRPKGVLYSHRALVLHSMAAALPDAMNISARDTVLPVVPMFHANAWGIPYTATMVGASIVLPGPRLDADSVLDLLADEKVTMTAGVPTVWMARPRRSRAPRSCLLRWTTPRPTHSSSTEPGRASRPRSSTSAPAATPAG